MFVYGATGAGKTHTMLGSVENPGIIFRTVMELYSRIDSAKEESEIEVVISYLEIYNETVIDLINPSTRLDIREDGKGVNIPGLSRHRPSGPDDLLRFVFNIFDAKGNKHRTPVLNISRIAISQLTKLMHHFKNSALTLVSKSNK